MPDDPRPPEPRTIDVQDERELRDLARELNVRPELLSQAVRQVGPNLVAVKLWLTAPRA